MKKRMRYLLEVFVLGMFILSGCTKNIEDTSNMSVTDIEENTEFSTDKYTEYLSPILSLKEADYIQSEDILYNIEDEKYYYIKDAQLKEVTMNDFSSFFIDEGTSYDINFRWCEFEGEIELFYDLSTMPEGFILETIPGNKDAVYLGKTIRIDGETRCRVCILGSNEIEPLFDGALEKGVEDPQGIHDVSLSSAAKTAIIDYKGKAMYYDGQQLLDLGIICGRDDADAVYAYFQKDVIIVSSIIFPYDDVSLRQVICYTYHPQTGKVEQVIDEVDGLAVWGHYGKYYSNDKLTFIDMFTGNVVTTEILLGDVREDRGITESLYGIFLEDGTFAVIDAATGKTVRKTEIPIKETSSVNMYWENDCLYVRVYTEEEIRVYKFE